MEIQLAQQDRNSLYCSYKMSVIKPYGTKPCFLGAFHYDAVFLWQKAGTLKGCDSPGVASLPVHHLCTYRAWTTISPQAETSAANRGASVSPEVQSLH
jgi:hypothetical protein